MIVFAVDPGPVESAWVVWDGLRIDAFGKAKNEQLLEPPEPVNRYVIEMISSMGMSVGETTFETVFWIGRFYQAWGGETYVSRIKRHEVKMHICHHPRAKDGNIRQALIDRIGAPGTKKAPGPTYGISGDCWQALALAVTYYDQNNGGEHVRSDRVLRAGA